jgi:hypothetical protein
MIDMLPFTDTGDTCEFLDDYDEICPFNTPGSPDVFYTYIPGEDTEINIDLCESAYDTKTYVYLEIEPMVFELVDCNDDACSDSQGNPFRSRLECVPLMAGMTYHIAVDGYGGECGVYNLVIDECEICDVECPEGGIPEGEPVCEENYVDTYNGGCNSDPPVFSEIACGDTICGEGGTYPFDGSNYRDTDWYAFNFGGGDLRWEGVAEFPFLMFIIEEPGEIGDCGVVILNSATAAPCEPAVVEVFDVGDSNYYVWAGASVFTDVPCGSEYVATLTCTILGACCLPDGSCIVTTEMDCMMQEGEYQGDYTNCSEFLYEADECMNEFMDISGTGTIAENASNSDDNGDIVPIGFEFSFFGNTYTEIGVCSNGYMTFGPDLSDFSNDPIPTATDPNDLIAPLWDDFDPVPDDPEDPDGVVYYETQGMEPDRVFIAQWTNMRQFGDSDSNTFQAILYEGSNMIEFRYGLITPEGTPGDYTIGVENIDGTAGTAIDASMVMEGDCWALMGIQTEDPCEVTELELYLDIKPGSCPNAFNRRSNGVLPVALLGEMDFDVLMVDVETLQLSRTDGVGGSVMPIRTAYDDVATPFMGEPCECHEMMGDGWVDLTMKFRSGMLVDELMLDEFMGGDEVPLVLSGMLLDGTPFTAVDCLWLVPPHNFGNAAD